MGGSAGTLSPHYPRGQCGDIVPVLPPGLGVVRGQCSGVVRGHCRGSGDIAGVVRGHCGGTAFCLPQLKKICILSLALNYLDISRLLAGAQNAPGQGALVGNYGVFDDFGGPVSGVVYIAISKKGWIFLRFHIKLEK